VSAALIDNAPAKINLTLRVLGRRADGYHDLESLVVFADVGDRLTLEPGQPITLANSGPFGAACGPVADNLVLKAAAALGQRVPGLVTGRFVLEKNLPVAAGIGGGSSDAAAALRLLARANDIALDDARLAASALAVGADVPVCLDPRGRIMRGVGERLSEPIDVPAMPAVLVNPGVSVPTRDVFVKFPLNAGGKKTLGEVPHGFDAMISFLDQHGNDLTQAATACAPEVADVLASLMTMPAVRLVRMSGSGATCFALFETAEDAHAAARCLQADRKDWWVSAATLG
jgi:4-diphosphocytidyl-2-C-methyl-D-erythritol kinase